MFSQHLNQIDSSKAEEVICQEDDEIKSLLEWIYHHYGFDFRNYAFPFIKRRLFHRIRAENIPTVSALQDQLLRDSSIMKKIFADFSINVTEMFRDPRFYLTFRTHVIPLLRDLPYIRIWHAGCSTGEEIYSMAILLHEEGLLEKAKIYATDINESNLDKAKQGIFPVSRMKIYTKNYLSAGGMRAFSEYYTTYNESVTFQHFLMKNIVLAQHNLATDHSFNQFHVIICRNVLIYFNKWLQNRVHHLFYESLGPSGILGLGTGENVKFTEFFNKYKEVDSIEKLYCKVR